MQRARPYDRDAALDAALTLFWQKGYHATSLKDLEATLGMKPGSIYAAFTSKEKLFNLALERYFEMNRAEFSAAIINAESPLHGLAGFMRALGRLTEDDPQRRACMIVKTLLNSTAEDAAISRQVEKYLDLMEAEMAIAFDRAKQLGEIPDDADCRRLARRYQSDITALKIEAYRGVDPDELAASADELADKLEAMRISRHIVA